MRPRHPVSSAQGLREACEALRRMQPRQPPEPDIRGLLSPLLSYLLAIICIWLGVEAVKGVKWWWSKAIPAMSMTIEPELEQERQKRLASVYDPYRTIGRYYLESLPDGSEYRAHYMGSLAIDQKPAHVELGDEYTYNGHRWIWMIPAGASAPKWVDP